MNRTITRTGIGLALALAAAACGDEGPGPDNQNNLNNNATGPVCGNAVVETGETCDDGAANSDVDPDACRTDCRPAHCGDGVVDPGEACEPGVLGDRTCADLGFGDGGTLACDAACGLDTAACLGWAGVAAGSNHSCGLRPDGRVRCWGRNAYGQVGREDPATSPEPTPVAGLPPATAIGAGEAHSCAITGSGTVHCWGVGGRLGDGTDAPSAAPVQVSGIEDASALAVGERTSCVIHRDGHLSCWGDNSSGQLGTGTPEPALALSPVVVPGLDDVVSVTIGWVHVCAVRATGALACWGEGLYGKLGNGSELSEPVPAEVGGLPPVRQVSAGRYHTCAVTREGEAWCWGRNDEGHLGRGSDTPRELEPMAVDDLPVTAVVAATNHTCALDPGGTVWCWGAGGAGRLGNGTTVSSALPVRVVGLQGAVALAALNTQTCAVTADHRLLCWGYSGDGELGPGTPDDRDVPVPTAGLAGVSSLDSGASHSCAVRADGTVVCWGAGANGRLGDGVSEDRAQPTQVFGLSGIAHVTAGGAHSCAARAGANAGVQCWGAGGWGQLGDGAREDSFVPVPVDWPDRPAGTTVTQLTAGTNHTCALLDDGSAWCWGSDWTGQLGDDVVWASKDQPVQVADESFDGSPVVSISAGDWYTCAVTGDGRAWCWGADHWGKLGDLDDSDHVVIQSSSCAFTPSPVHVPAGMPALVAIAAGVNHTCAIGQDGTAWCWGRNWWGTLGRPGGDSATPVQVVGPASILPGVTGISPGYDHTCAVLTDGTVWCWGYELEGALGAGTFGSSDAQLVPMLEVANVATVTAGYWGTCARLTNGTVWCTGQNSCGQNGDGTFARSTVPVDVPDVAASGD